MFADFLLPKNQFVLVESNNKIKGINIYFKKIIYLNLYLTFDSFKSSLSAYNNNKN